MEWLHYPVPKLYIENHDGWMGFWLNEMDKSLVLASNKLNIKGLVSVIIPLYNHERYIAQLIESIAQSSYEFVEILICDDASLDRSYDVCKKALSPLSFRTVLLRNDDNLGVSSTLNRLIDLAKGEYILPIASDDVLINDSIVSRVMFFESQHNVGVVVGDCIVIDAAGEQLSGKGVIKGVVGDVLNGVSDFTDDTMIKCWCLPGPVIMYRSRVLDNVGIYNAKYKQEDFDFFLRLIINENIFYTPNIVSKYRRCGGEPFNRDESIRRTLENLAVCFRYIMEPNLRFGIRIALCIRVLKLFSGFFKFLCLRAGRLVI